MPPLFTTSWDDGHPLDFRVADMLRRHGLTGTFYIPRTAPTGVMSEAEIRQLSQSFEIGAHTLNHVFLTQTPTLQARQEISDSRLWVQSLTGQACIMFCPPAGKFSSAHVRMIRDAGFVGLRSVEMLSLSPPRLHRGLLIMPTTLQAHPHKPLSLLKNFAKRFSIQNLWRYILHGNASDWPSAAASLLNLTARHGGVFHLWGHSWELEQANQWSRLDQVFALMAQFTKDSPCLTNSAICAATLSAANEPQLTHTPLSSPLDPGANRVCH